MEPSGDFSIRLLLDDFGVEPRDIDLARCGPDIYRAVVETFDRHGIMVIRGQTLSPQDQMRVTQAFGMPEDNPRKEFTHPGTPEIYVISNKVVDGRKIGDPSAGQGWHTDSSFLAAPMKCTMLYAMEVPTKVRTRWSPICAQPGPPCRPNVGLRSTDCRFSIAGGP
jgi:taurine dioxygenase